MKKFACRSLMTVILSLLLVGSACAENIEIVGTGDGAAVLEAIGSAFSGTHSGTSVSVPKSIGSGGGIKAVGKGDNKIGRVARAIKDKEKHFGLTYVPFAKTPVVFFVNQGVGVDNLTSQQIIAIYSGQIRNWREVGGQDGKIRVVRREDGDSSLSALKKTFPGFADLTMTDKSKTALKTSEMFSIVSGKAGTIGFGPNDVAAISDVHILNIDGHKPTDPNYPTNTTLALIFKEANKVGMLKEFIEFTTSTAAHSAIIAANAVPTTK